MVDVCTIAGTRPELIRLSEIIRKLDVLCNHKFVYTGQNSDPLLSDLFFKDLDIREPDYIYRPTSNVFYQQIAEIFSNVSQYIQEIAPKKVLILGDTNSCLISIMIERLGIPVYHLEAGNRCFDNAVPEEINRKVIDHACSFNLPYTEKSANNLLAEGMHKSRIFVCGNPVYEVAKKNWPIHCADRKDNFGLLTVHRSENMTHLEEILMSIGEIDCNFIFPIHPKTASNIHFDIPSNIDVVDPMSFSAMLDVYQQVCLVLTDSGTVQEEACIFGIPCVVLRRSTERPETVESGNTIVSGRGHDDIIRCAKIAKSLVGPFSIPEAYIAENVSSVVSNIILCGGE